MTPQQQPRPHSIGLWMGDKVIEGDRLWKLLSCRFPVRFVARDENGMAGTDSASIVCAGGKRCDASSRLPTYRVDGHCLWGRRAQPLRIHFASASCLEGWLHDSVIVGGNLWPESPLRVCDGEEVVCRYQDGALWTTRLQDGVRHHRVAAPVMQLRTDETLFDQVDALRFLQLLSVVVFLGEVTGEGAWQSPSLKAAMMLDDPNLHWPTYGYVDFAEVVRNARTVNYHVAIATVPLDCYYADRRCVNLFATNRDRLSLLVHGNNHTRRELAAKLASEERQRNLCEALQRISTFERRTGLQVARVIAPPHGGIIEDAVVDIGRVGFEAIVTSLGTLRRYNADRPWISEIGVRPADFIAGVPSFSRSGLSSVCIAEVALAFLLKMPVILCGHHEDLRCGVGRLNAAADMINGFGNVMWADMKRIVEQSYVFRVEADTMRVRLYARRAVIGVPAGVRFLRIEDPVWAQGLTYTLAERDHGVISIGDTIEVSDRDEVEIKVVDGVNSIPTNVKGRNAGVWPLARRMLCEGRDRLMPLWRRRKVAV